MTVTKMEVSPLLTLSSGSDNPEVTPTPDPYEGEFSSREYDDFDDFDEEEF